MGYSTEDAMASSISIFHFKELREILRQEIFCAILFGLIWVEGILWWGCLTVLLLAMKPIEESPGICTSSYLKKKSPRWSVPRGLCEQVLLYWPLTTATKLPAS
jgi:hypothetical protein